MNMKRHGVEFVNLCPIAITSSESRLAKSDVSLKEGPAARETRCPPIGFGDGGYQLLPMDRPMVFIVIIQRCT